MVNGHHSKCKSVHRTVSPAFISDKTVTGSSVGAQNIFCHIKGRTEAECVREQGAEEGIWI